MPMNNWADADITDEQIVTDMYGTVTPATHDYLRDNGVTPSEWDLLMQAFGRSAQGEACAWIARYQTDAGRYDSYHAERALETSGRLSH